MAEVFKPYQSIGERFQKTQMPQGLALQEGRRTMAVLSQSMDRMTNFALRQMETQAKIQGAEFGVENAPTLKMVQDANAENTDAFEQFDTSTVFGRAAKDAAITVLENDVYVTATEQINDTVFQATLNKIEPSALRDSLDSIIMGYEGILSPTAPALAKKLTARLGLSAASQFNAYQKASISDATNSINSGHYTSVDRRIQNLSSELDALVGSNSLNNETISFLETRFNSFVQSVPGAYTKSMITTELDNWNKGVNSWAEGKILNFALESTNASVVANKIVAGKSLGNEEMDNIFGLQRLNNTDFRQAVATRIRNEIRLKRETNSALENIESDTKKRLGENARLEFIKLTKNPMTEEQYQSALGHIEVVTKYIGDTDANRLTTILKDTRILNDGTRRAVSDTTDIRVVRVLNLARQGELTFAQLERVQHLLDGDDFDLATTAVENSLNEDYTQAVRILKKLGYDPNANILEDKDDDFFKISKKLYTEGITKLDEAISQAKKKDEDVNLQFIASEFVATNGELLQKRTNELLKKQAEINASSQVESVMLKDQLQEELISKFTEGEHIANLKLIVRYIKANRTDNEALRKLNLQITKDNAPKRITAFENIIKRAEGTE
tara:strand:- start:8941 stop:10788 length:1848 start_codon:yes stop_codon:yes gene_type:complete